MWRPATRTTGTNDVPLGNTRRFGLPEEAPPPPPPTSGPPSYAKPPADIQFFNGRVDRDRGARGGDDDRRGGGDDRYESRAPREYEDRGGRRDDYRDDNRDRGDRRDDHDRDRYGDRDRGRGSSRWDDDRSSDRGADRGRDPAHEEGPRKRRSRWGDASDKVDVAGMPVTVTGKVSASVLDNYAIHVRLEEINRKLRVGDIVPPDGMRSPSPPPRFDAYGRRTNTREQRYREKLEQERMRLIDRAMKNDPSFRPPADAQQHRRGQRPMDKVYIPVKEFPEINFFGLLVGPRGNSLKRMERESGAKISIRGKGSVKDGKGRPDAFANDEEDELHCVVTGENEQAVRACVALINKVIETAASTPEGQNDHKRNQLRELASLNGTLRDDENQLCQNCGEKGHRRFDCPQQRQYNANVICRLCGGAGHMARDCRGRGDPSLAQNKQSQFDSEYTALMAELGESGGASNTPAGAGAGEGAAPSEQRVPPWRLPENWQNHRHFNNTNGSNNGQGGYNQGGYNQNQGGQGGYGGGYGGYNRQQQQLSQDQGQDAGGYGYGGYGQQQSQQYSSDQDAYAAYYAQLGQQPPPLPAT